MQYYHFVIKQCVAGIWTELIKVETENKVTSIGATKGLEELTGKIFNSGKMFITKELESVIFNTDKWPVKLYMIKGPILK